MGGCSAVCEVRRKLTTLRPHTQAGSFLLGEPENVRHLGAVPGAKSAERQRRRPARAVYCSAVCGHRILIPDFDVRSLPTRELQCNKRILQA